jgi:hypothetical protein
MVSRTVGIAVALTKSEGRKPVRLTHLVMAALLGVGTTMSAAKAAIITGSYDFTVGGFVAFQGLVEVPGIPAPVEPVSGSFSFSFDNSSSFDEQTARVSFTSNLVLQSPVGITYFRSPDLLILGGTFFSPAGFPPGSYDFTLQIRDVSTAPSIDTVFYSQGGMYFRSDPRSVGTSSLTPVPEPASFAVFIAGLLGLGLIRCRRRSA